MSCFRRWVRSSDARCDMLKNVSLEKGATSIPCAVLLGASCGVLPKLVARLTSEISCVLGLAEDAHACCQEVMVTCQIANEGDHHSVSVSVPHAASTRAF